MFLAENLIKFVVEDEAVDNPVENLKDLNPEAVPKVRYSFLESDILISK